MNDTVTLTDAIRALRSQLEEAAKDGALSDVRFVPKAVEVELEIKFSLEAEAAGGFKLLSLIDVSGKLKAAGTDSHKVKLILEPVGKDGKPYLICDADRER